VEEGQGGGSGRRPRENREERRPAPGFLRRRDVSSTSLRDGLKRILELPLDLAGLGEATGLLLGEEELVVEGDFEAASRTLDELGIEAELLPDLVRQTGGTRVVVSDGAVLDGKIAGHLALLSTRL
jgi:hypothetical protein